MSTRRSRKSSVVARLPTVLAVVLAVLLAAPGGAQSAAPKPTRPGKAQSKATEQGILEARLAVAEDAAKWLDDHAVKVGDDIESPIDLQWPVDVEAERPRFDCYLYSGAAGIVLFYLEHHHATGRARSLARAQAGARGIWSKVGDQLERQPMGLYTGVAGLAFVFAELHRTTGDAEDLRRAHACVDAVLEAMGKRHERAWSKVTDIISGTAGTGLALLRLAADLQREDALKAAIEAGDGLLAGAKPVGPDGAWRRWDMSPGYAREMPNFSHGTAGVAYFLAKLHEATKAKRFLDGAKAGAAYLLSITDDHGRIHHNQKAKDLFYLGWCHGPAGTARLFQVLQATTGEAKYGAWIDTAAIHLTQSPIPQRKTPGFWNNHGQCCGTAGIADFFLHLGARQLDAQRIEARQLDASKKAQAHADRRNALFAALAAAANPRGAWRGAEHRVRPDWLSTQTGYAQGTAGIGLAFLHDVALMRRVARRIVLPDSPYPR